MMLEGWAFLDLLDTEEGTKAGKRTKEMFAEDI